MATTLAATKRASATAVNTQEVVAMGNNRISMQLTSGGVQVFNFIVGTGPLVVKKTYSGVVYAADDAATDAVLSWIIARDEHAEKLKAIHNDYQALIKGARTLEEVIEI
jgi:hypothetical protein